MIKYYCDICGDEITETNKVPSTFQGELVSKVSGIKKKLKVVLDFPKDTGFAIDENGNTKDWTCKYCMIDAINTQDDRAKAC